MKQMLYRFLLIVCLSSTASIAKPFIPTHDEQVLEILPAKLISTSQRHVLSRARQAWRADPRNIYTVNTLARLYIAQSRQLADPRYLGYAEALLEPWAALTRVPTTIRLLRAILLQRNHHFEPALLELKKILQEDPAQSEALLTQATIQQVRADYENARKTCQHLYTLSTLMIGMTCTAQIDGLTGKAESALQRMSTLLNLKNSGLSLEIQVWMRLTTIELAQRAGRTAEVDIHFKKLLLEQIPLAPEAKAAYADWLLSQQRFEDVIALGTNDNHDDGMVLRVVIAEEALNLPTATTHRTLLKDRFAAARLRGDHVHQREESRFTLSVLQQPQEALALAQANWLIQREPADAQLLLEAALKAGKPLTAQPVLQWLKDSHFQDKNLLQQAAEIERMIGAAS